MASLNELRQCLCEGVPLGTSSDDGVRRQWWAALATLQEDFLLPLADVRGLWLAAPLPALYEPALLRRLDGWVWSPGPLETLLPPAAPLLPQGQAASAGSGLGDGNDDGDGGPGFRRLRLAPEDGEDPVLLLITPSLQVALCLDGPAERRRLVVRFDAAVLSKGLSLIHERLEEDDPVAAGALRASVQQLGPLHTDASLGPRFWPRLADRLATIAPSLTLQPLVSEPRPESSQALHAELALLEALTHEVRTPLATIRTLIRSLLRRHDLPVVVRQRLEHIDGECSEQIDRFGLIFLAAELQRRPEREEHDADLPLARTDLSQLLKQLEGLWQRQLERRDLGLQLAIADGLPAVLSDPARLETMLGGLIDRFSRSLAAGSTVTVSLQPAGARLKLQLSSGGAPARPATSSPRSSSPASPPGAGSSPERDTVRDTERELVGPVLSWNPATGSLQLSRQATQQLFERMGGRLTERSGSGLTVFFPAC